MTDCIRYLPAGAREPETPLEVLLLAREVLREPGRWLKGDMYMAKPDGLGREDPDPESPYIGGWKVCATGACFAVTLGASRTASGAWVLIGQPITSPLSKLYRAAVKLLDSCTPQDQREEIFAPIKGAPHTDVVWMQDFNDFGETTLEQVLAVFDAAIVKAQSASTATEAAEQSEEETV